MIPNDLPQLTCGCLARRSGLRPVQKLCRKSPSISTGGTVALSHWGSPEQTAPSCQPLSRRRPSGAAPSRLTAASNEHVLLSGPQQSNLHLIWNDGKRETSTRISRSSAYTPTVIDKKRRLGNLPRPAERTSNKARCTKFWPGAPDRQQSHRARPRRHRAYFQFEHAVGYRNIIDI